MIKTKLPLNICKHGKTQKHEYLMTNCYLIIFFISPMFTNFRFIHILNFERLIEEIQNIINTVKLTTI